MLHGTLGLLFYRAGLWDRAVKELEESLKYEPNEDIRRRLDEARENMGNTTEPSTEPTTNPT